MLASKYTKAIIFSFKANRRAWAITRSKFRSQQSRHLTGPTLPFEESFDSPINFHVTLFLEGIHSKRLSVITVRNVLSYWTSFTEVLEGTQSQKSPQTQEIRLNKDFLGRSVCLNCIFYAYVELLLSDGWKFLICL